MGGKRETGTSHDLAVEHVLQVIEFVQMPFALFQCFNHYAMLQALLYDGLDATVTVPNLETAA